MCLFIKGDNLLFSFRSLIKSKIFEKSYDGASNIQRELHNLKTLILNRLHRHIAFIVLTTNYC